MGSEMCIRDRCTSTPFSVPVTFHTVCILLLFSSIKARNVFYMLYIWYMLSILCVFFLNVHRKSLSEPGVSCPEASVISAAVVSLFSEQINDDDDDDDDDNEKVSGRALALRSPSLGKTIGGPCRSISAIW